MPLVIDANVANALAAGGCRSSKRILDWVRTKGLVVSGGQLQRELSQTQLKSLLIAWSAAGRLQLLSGALIEAEAERITPLAASNDAHVLAVVTVGDAGVIVTGDELLKRDLKSTQITGRKRKIISHSASGFSADIIVQSLLRLYA